MTVTVLALFVAVSAGDVSVPLAGEPAPPRGAIPAAASSKSVSAAHVVYYSPDEVPVIYTKIRFATAIIFPEPERILEVVCGDKDWWQIAGPDRIIYIKPSRAGIATNLTVIGATGNVYEFFLQEITPTPGVPAAPTDTPYVKVSMRLGETFAQRAADNNVQKYVAKAEMDAALEAADQRVRAANEEARGLKSAAANVIAQEVTRIRTNYPAGLQFDYQIALDTKPFFVRAMFADDKFTYIKLDSQEAPAIYEVKDGKPSLVNFDFVNGVFVIRKVVDQGYLAIGKAKLAFSRKAK